MGFINYITGIFTAVKNLLIGMGVTWKELWAKKVTMQYPENRDTLVISDRWRAELIMPHDDSNEHACTACTICMMNCPNGTIEVIPETIVTEEGKKKKILNRHIWDAGKCTYCNLCVITCPSDAIIFSNDFEGAVYDRNVLVHKLNREGSKLREKKRPAPVPKPAPAPKSEIVNSTTTTSHAESNKVVEEKSLATKVESNPTENLEKTATKTIKTKIEKPQDTEEQPKEVKTADAEKIEKTENI